jgi:hypothetical protein
VIALTLRLRRYYAAQSASPLVYQPIPTFQSGARYRIPEYHPNKIKCGFRCWRLSGTLLFGRAALPPTERERSTDFEDKTPARWPGIARWIENGLRTMYDAGESVEANQPSSV